uniref:Uncharacterized protein AlNc14C85G5475 n=1 Tax=Albugo laibachii Nc14 TaxID=890382 RepID=F0WFU0_9STRA|nr:conserved hypothetical protein [Albugo laibachii Nc14]|eukprot:CCA20074.1 conserved hypothetical protein [Albugo laibachii Nc14]
MEFHYEIPCERIKVFVAALQSLSAIDKEVSFECENTKQLTLRSINDAQSAAGHVTFLSDFFSKPIHLHIPSSLPHPHTDRIIAKCKLYNKLCCNVFRSISIVQSVHLVIRLEPFHSESQLKASDSKSRKRRRDVESEKTSSSDECPFSDEDPILDAIELIWELHCDHDILKTHRLQVSTCDLLRPLFDCDFALNRLVMRPHTLASILDPVRHANEVRFTFSSSHIRMETNVSQSAKEKTFLHTEAAFETGELTAYTLHKNETIDLIFSSRELKTFQTFCKVSDVPSISIHFDLAGRFAQRKAQPVAHRCCSPVLFSTKASSVSAEWMLSTLEPEIAESQESHELF